jgi:hypothetical protein
MMSEGSIASQKRGKEARSTERLGTDRDVWMMVKTGHAMMVREFHCVISRQRNIFRGDLKTTKGFQSATDRSRITPWNCISVVIWRRVPAKLYTNPQIDGSVREHPFVVR